MARSVHARSLGDTVQALLILDLAKKPHNVSSLSEQTLLSPRHLYACLKVLAKLGVISREQDRAWHGAGVRYRYAVDIPQALHYGYLSTEKLAFYQEKIHRAAA